MTLASHVGHAARVPALLALVWLAGDPRRQARYEIHTSEVTGPWPAALELVAVGVAFMIVALWEPGGVVGHPAAADQPSALRATLQGGDGAERRARIPWPFPRRPTVPRGMAGAGDPAAAGGAVAEHAIPRRVRRAEHIRAVATARVAETLGNVGPAVLSQVRDTLATLLDI